MTDQAADIAQFTVRVLVVLVPLFTSAAQLVLTNYTVPPFGLPVWMSNHASAPLFLSSQSVSGLFHPATRRTYHCADCLQVAGFTSKPGNIN